MDRSRKADDLALALELTRAASGLRRRLDVQGLSFREFAVLHHLAHSPERRLRRLDLVELLGITPSGVARLLAPLEKQGYVDRCPDPRDARRALVTLTGAGAALAEEATAVATDKASALLGRALGPVDREAFAALLHRFTEVL
ncbi:MULTISPECIES: MarR family winged helix-turn-helix transcriptional regulator [Streptomyces violaceoruber group]|uniref:MarR family transcriptional regulator n=1 Tax=Streptomyces rubrogriseus TaxID=194673 RepID=A0A6G3T803_9ACTN|nr:helix-turn-helix domain-containing protein [Streptomyces rubrogriseus]NEC32565.1 MarR family transcriptional regulator [Streptomyces rubrogriseus]